MNRFMLEEFHKDPVLLRRRLTTEAHRQRSQALGDAIAALFGALFSGTGRLFNYVKSRLTPRPQCWIGRLG